MIVPKSLIRALREARPTNLAPISYTGRNRLSMPFLQHNDLESQMRSLGAVGTLFAIVDKCATATAGLKWHLYRKAKSGLTEDRVEVTSHPALSLLNRPNNFTTTQELFEAGQQHHELTGETWLVVGRNPLVPAIPLELWNVRPDRMKPVPHAEKFISGYIYTSADGEEVPLKLTDVIFMRRPNPLDPFRGMGAVQTIKTWIDAERYSAEWNRNFFVNGAQPGAVIEVEKRLSDPEFDEMVDRWREQHQGIANAHRVAVLENGAKYVDTKLTQKDMDFTGLSGLAAEKIRESFGFPVPMLGGVDNVNLANAQAGEYVFSKWLVVPRGERWKGALNNDLLPLFGPIGEGLEFDYESPVPADRAADDAERDSKIKAAVAAIGTGFDPAEVMAWLDLPDMSFTKPSPPPSPSPPPGGGGSTPAVPAGPGAPGAPAAPAGPEGSTHRLVRLLAEHPDLVDLVHQLSSGRERHDGHGGRRSPAGDDPGDDPWPLRGAAPLPDPGPLAPATPSAPDGIAPLLAIEALPDLGPVQDAWTETLDALLARWPDLQTDQQEALLDAIAGRVSAGDVLGLTGINTPSVVRSAAVLEQAMMTLGATAGDQVVTEARGQGVTGMHAMAPDRMRTASVAQTITTLLARDLLASGIGEALRTWRAGSTADQVRAQVSNHLSGLSDARPRMLLGAALTGAQHDGRAKTIAGGPEAALYADEVLDGATCDRCRAINRKWIGNSGDAMVLDTYPVAGYVGCRGRSRCRGQVVAVWRGGSDWSKWVEMP